MSDQEVENETKNAIQNIFGDSDDDEEDLGDVKQLPTFKKFEHLEPIKRKKKPKRSNSVEEITDRELTTDELRKKQVQDDVNSIMSRLKTQKHKPQDLQTEVMVDETIAMF